MLIALPSMTWWYVQRSKDPGGLHVIKSSGEGKSYCVAFNYVAPTALDDWTYERNRHLLEQGLCFMFRVLTLAMPDLVIE